MPTDSAVYGQKDMMAKLDKMPLKRLLARIRYRCWQFKQVLFPKIDPALWHKALMFLPVEYRPYLEKLRPSERAHVLRVFEAIERAENLSAEERDFLQLLALTHDLGKGVTRHSLFFKIVKVLFPISNAKHCIEGARLLKRLKADRRLIRLVLRHHQNSPEDPVLRKFQSFDDRL
ncbi:MAG: HD domain-containing protein [Candidatus Rifleibacteriota bacterium]